MGKKVIKYLLFLLLAITLLFFSFKGMDWEDFSNGLKSCNYYWIIFSMLVSIIAFYVRALRWRLLMLPLNSEIKRKEAFNGVTIAYLTNFALPRAGEFARCGIIAQTKKISFQATLGSVVIERTFDLLSLIALVFCLLFFKWAEFGSFIQIHILGPISNKFGVGILWISFSLVIIGIISLYLIWKKREVLLRYSIFQKIYKVLEGLWEGLSSGLRMKNKGLFIFQTILLWGCYWLMSLSTIYAFPGVMGLNGTDALFLMIVGGLGWIVPVQGGLGAFHFIVSLALVSVYGISQIDGVIFATISHGSQSLTMILGGIYSLISIAISKKRSK